MSSTKQKRDSSDLDDLDDFDDDDETAFHSADEGEDENLPMGQTCLVNTQQHSPPMTAKQSGPEQDSIKTPISAQEEEASEGKQENATESKLDRDQKSISASASDQRKRASVESKEDPVESKWEEESVEPKLEPSKSKMDADRLEVEVKSKLTEPNKSEIGTKEKPMRSKIAATEEQQMKQEPIKTKPIEVKKKWDEKEPMESPSADGWDVDDWDAGDTAGDEGQMEWNDWNDENESDELMMTPSSEKPPANDPTVQRTSEPKPTVQKATVPDLQRMEPAVHRMEATTAQKPSSLWGGWGQQLLSLASDSINTLTNSVGEGLTSVLETVETSLGAPTPEELAKLSLHERDALRKKADQVKEPAPVGEKDDCDSASEEVSSEGGSDIGTTRSEKEDALSSGYQSDSIPAAQQLSATADKRDPALGSLFSVLENTGKTLVTGSLDVLETLGRKTFETMTVAETSGESQRRRLKIATTGGSDKPTLSQILRELKEQAEEEAKQKQQQQEARKCNYAALFEDAQGLVYLEALELLSTSCGQQTRSLLELLTPEQMEDVSTWMENLKSLFESAVVKDVLEEEATEPNFELSVKIDLKFTSVAPSRLLSLDQEARNWINRIIEEQNEGNRVDAKEIYEKCLQTLATFTAASVDVYHKVGQSLLIPNAIPVQMLSIGNDQILKAITSLTRTLSEELSFLCSRFTTSLTTASDDSEDPDTVSHMLTNVFYESGNSVGYLQEAFKLMMPVIQLATIRQLLR